MAVPGAVQEAGVMAEFWNLVLLVVLYGMQGVPLGLCLGAMCGPTASRSQTVLLFIQNVWCTGCAGVQFSLPAVLSSLLSVFLMLQGFTGTGCAAALC